MSHSQDPSTESGDVSPLRVNRRLVLYSSSESQEDGRTASESSSNSASSKDNVPLSEHISAVAPLAKKPSKLVSAKSHGASSAPQSNPVAPEVNSNENPVQDEQVEDSVEEEKEEVDPTNNDDVDMARDKTPDPEIVEDLARELDGVKKRPKRKDKRDSRSSPSKKAKTSSRKRRAPVASRTRAQMAKQEAYSSKKGKSQNVPVSIDLSDEEQETVAAPVSSTRNIPSGSVYQPCLRYETYHRFWSVVIGKNLVVERPLDPQKVVLTGTYQLLRDCDLLDTVLPVRTFVKNVVLEFYANLSKTTFDPTSADFYRTWVRGHFIEFSPNVIDRAVGRDDTVYPDHEVSFHEVAKELTQGAFTRWPSENYITSSRLSIRYSILHKIAIRNWIPSKHRSSVGKGLATLLYKVGMRIPINFGNLVFGVVGSHAESLKKGGALGYPGLIFKIITEQADVLLADDCYEPAPDPLIISKKLYNEDLHIKDVEAVSKGRQKGHGRTKVTTGVPVKAARLQVMASRVTQQLEKEYVHLGKTIAAATERRNEIESLLYDLRHGDALEEGAGPSNDDQDSPVGDINPEDEEEEPNAEESESSLADSESDSL